MIKERIRLKNMYEFRFRFFDAENKSTFVEYKNAMGQSVRVIYYIKITL